MTAKYYTLLTEVGAAKLANATALGVPLKLTHMAVGDGGGTLPTPSSKQVALVGEKRRAALNSLSIDPQNASQIIAEQVIPENDGGWWVREIGLFDEAGDLIAVGNCPESYKPQLAEGSGRTQTVRMVIITSSTDSITLKIDPSVVLATRGYVDNLIETRQQKSDTLTALAALKPAKGKLPYFTAEKAAALADLSDFIRLMLNKGDAAGVLEYLGLSEVAKGVSMVGISRNARIDIASATEAATFTADEITVGTAPGGNIYRLTGINKTINLATIGAGGMDTGTVPTNGFVAIYVIYNPATNIQALLAVNATSVAVSEVYSGSNMPAGFTASALISVWRTSSGLFVSGTQRNRKVMFVPIAALSSSIQASSFTSLSLTTCVPFNAVSIDGTINPNIAGTGANTNLAVAPRADGVGAMRVGCGGAAILAPFSGLLIATPQTIYYTLTASAPLQTSFISITGYEI